MFEVTTSMQNSGYGNKENGDRLNSASHCLNHPNRTAVYETKGESTERYVYCEKCSILLASQGFKVMKISKSVQDRN